MNYKDISKKVNVKLNTKPEKAIMAASISTALAILTISSKKKKGKPNFFQRIGKYYNSVDKLLVMTVAKDVAKEEKRKAAMKEFSNKKLREMEIEKAIPIDLSELCEEKTENEEK
ncbi:hypothetical protein [Ruminococcus sp.]|uniref:hypothetical protein n=1 Tax=Ruminococcus sp. TaxID=41978 RepID=UPI0025DDA42F|nr:hypothetical protein [Ruminococcus sp.]MBQ8967921.1 hypothetical protein [Ruminococcus sp.]